MRTITSAAQPRTCFLQGWHGLWQLTQLPKPCFHPPLKPFRTRAKRHGGCFWQRRPGADTAKMVKHNNVVPNQHFKKHWQGGKNAKGCYVRTWFNQPARKTRRANARAEKAKKIFPRPTAGPLRPIVHGQTIKYNLKKRLGRGFSFEELKEAGIPIKLAATIGIAVDHRRHNRSLESLQENAARLKAYKANLVLFPRRSRKPKAGDAPAEELGVAGRQQHAGVLMPIARVAHELETVEITDEMREEKAYYRLRLERTNKKLVGVRAKRAADAAAEEKDKAK